MSARAGEAGKPTYRDALCVRPFRLLLASHALATTGQLLLTLALGVAVLERTGSAPGTSVSVALGFAPYVVCSGFAGIVADRRSRSRVLAGSAVLRGGLAAGLVIAIATGAPTWSMVMVVVATSIAATVGYPALAAATVQCVPDRQLPAANALVTGAENALWIAAPGILGALTLLGLGPGSVTAVAALLLVTAAVCAHAAPLPPPLSAVMPAPRTPLVGLLLVVRDARVRRPMLVAIASNALYGFLVVHLILLSGAWLNAAFAVGAFLALAVAHQLAGTVRPAAMLLWAMGAFAGAAGTVGLTGAGLGSALPIAVAGAASLVSEVLAVTMLQRAVAETVVARLFGVYDQLNVGAIALGSMLAGPLSMALGIGPALVVAAAACMVASLVAAGPMRLETPRLTRTAATLPGPGREGRAW
jgi:MFS family permease